MYYKVEKDGVISAEYSVKLFGELIELPENNINLGLDKYIDGEVVKATSAQVQAREAEIALKSNEYEALAQKQHQIQSLKEELDKVKEDIEQVDLFGMVREDIDQKRLRAAVIVWALRVLEEKCTIYGVTIDLREAVKKEIKG